MWQIDWRCPRQETNNKVVFTPQKWLDLGQKWAELDEFKKDFESKICKIWWLFVHRESGRQDDSQISDKRDWIIAEKRCGRRNSFINWRIFVWFPGRKISDQLSSASVFLLAKYCLSSWKTLAGFLSLGNESGNNSETSKEGSGLSSDLWNDYFHHLSEHWVLPVELQS